MRSATIFTESNFTTGSWVMNQYEKERSTYAVNVNIQQETKPSGGNPGRFSMLSIHGERGTQSSTVPIQASVAHFNQLAIFYPQRKGLIDSIDFSFDLNMFDSRDSSTTYSLLLLQDGQIFSSPPIQVSAKQKKWRGYVLNNVKSQHFSSSGIPQHPNFSGSAIQFGYLVEATSQDNVFHSVTGIDNWKVIVTHHETSGMDPEELRRRLISETQERQRLESQLSTEKVRFEKELCERQIAAERELRQLEAQKTSNSLGNSVGPRGDYSSIVKAAQGTKQREKELLEEKKHLEEQLAEALSENDLLLERAEDAEVEKEEIQKGYERRFQEFQALHADLAVKMNKLTEEHKDLETSHKYSVEEVTSLQEFLAKEQESNREFASITEELHKELENERNARDVYTTELQGRKADVEELQKKLRAVELELNSRSEQIEEVTAALEQSSAMNLRTQAEVVTISSKVEELLRICEERDNAIKAKEANINELNEQLAKAKLEQEGHSMRMTEDMRKLVDENCALEERLEAQVQLVKSLREQLTEEEAVQKELEEANRVQWEAKTKLSDELQKERALRTEVETLLAQERNHGEQFASEKENVVKESAQAIAALVKELAEEREVVRQLQEQVEVESEARAQAENALEQLDQIFLVGSAESKSS